MDSTTSLLPLLWLIVVVALIPAVLWLVKRMGLVKLPASSALRTIHIQALSPTHRIQTVEVGEGEQRVWLVLGITPHSITTLHTLPPDSLDAAAAGRSSAPATATGTSFAQALAALRGNAHPPGGASGR